MNIIERLLAVVEGIWAKHHVHLLPEPSGERHGVAGADLMGKPISLLVVGDSMVAGCGTPDQSQGFVPILAGLIAEREQRPVSWRAVGKLGATMRRVRFRLLPEASRQAPRSDILVLCAGSNDVMAMRGREEWRDDLTASIEEAKSLADRVVVLSAGQPHNSPVLGKALRKALAAHIDEQTEVSVEVCRQTGVEYVPLAHADIGDPSVFWASDGFHPSVAGYRRCAGVIVEHMMRETSV